MKSQIPNHKSQMFKKTAAYATNAKTSNNKSQITKNKFQNPNPKILKTEISEGPKDSFVDSFGRFYWETQRKR